MDENAVDNVKVTEEKKKKPLMFYIGIFAAQIIVSFCLLFFLILPMVKGDTSEDAESTDQKKETAREAQTPSLEHTFTVENLTVNPKNSLGKRFAIFEIVLAVDDAETVEMLKVKNPALTDRYIRYFRSKTTEELAVGTVMKEGRVDLMRIANEVLGGDQIRDIYFTRFVLQ